MTISRIRWHSAEEKPANSGKYLVITDCGNVTDLYYLKDEGAGWNCSKSFVTGEIHTDFCMNDDIVAWSDCMTQMAHVRKEIESTHGN